MYLGHNRYQFSAGLNDNAGLISFSDVDLRFERHYFTIEFYQDEELTQPVATENMAGEVVIKVGVTELQYFTMQKGTIALGAANYDMPTAMGSYASYQVDTTGITGDGGANFLKLLVNVYEG